MIALIVVPLIAALIAFALSSARWRPHVVSAAGFTHVLMTFRLRTGQASPGGWLAVDPLGQIILGVVSILFTLCSLYAIGYLRVRSERPNRIFTVCLLTFLAMTTV